MPKFLQCEQGSAQWLQARCGRITASRVADVMAYLKSGKGEMKVRADYRMDLVAERLTSNSTDHFVSREMEWGSEYEPMARMMYEVAMDVLVDQVGFAIHPVMDFTGASPDALVGSDGGLEVKCPKTTTHLGYIMAGIVPEEYKPQMYWNMVCCERSWWDFVSYDPRLPQDLQLFCVRLEYDQKIVNEMAAEVRQFNAEVEASIKSLKKMEK